ncbi:MAG: DUF721 domain-containing protein [Planctomycetota bacterium]|nr:MAG: DUF721 domain-containing protein [Planctomycetota bacterium]
MSFVARRLSPVARWGDSPASGKLLQVAPWCSRLNIWSMAYPHQSEPQRDRALAAKPRYGPRFAVPLGQALAQVLSPQDLQRLRRQGPLLAVVQRVIPPALHSQVQLSSWRGGVLSLSVQGSPLLAELRQFYHAPLLQALQAEGFGVTRLRWQMALARSPRGAQR